MSDRTSSELFSEVFMMIDDHIDDEDTRYELARRFWGMMREYDFDYSEMDCDDTLIRLGLAHTVVDPDGSGEMVTIYDGGG